MKFDEARELLHHKKVPYKVSNGETRIKYVKRNNKEIRAVVDELEDEYAPITKMSKEAHDLILEYLNDGYFEDFVQMIWLDQTKREKLYSDLSIEDMMFAWLYPNRIVEVEE